MGKQILGAILIIAIIIGGYYGYKKYQEQKLANSGDVHCMVNCDTPEEQARFARENSGDTADGQSEHKQHSSQQDAAIIAQGGFPDGSGPAPATAATPPPPGAVSNQPLTAGAYSPNGPAPQSAQSPQTTGYAPSPSGAMAPTAVRYPAQAPTGLPMSDSQMANAPNGARFGANGTFQWYRQGNLTWRVNSTNGHSCIDFATMEEWRKQIVMEHGCGRDA